jgi:type IV pilus assembly protein PilN
MTRLNLLPWREMRRRELDRQLLMLGIGTWTIMGLIVFYGYIHVSNMIEEQGRRNDYLKKEIAKVEQEIKEIDGLKKKRQDLISRMNVIYQLQSDRGRMVHMFDDLVRKLPGGVYFTSVKHSGGNTNLQGTAQSNARVSALMRNLTSSDWFAEPQLEVINVKERGGERVSEFSLKVKQVVKQKLPQESGK